MSIAREGEATYTLSGSLMKAGNSIMVALTLQKPRTSEVISSPNIQCDGEEAILSRVDELGNQIKADLKLTSEQIAGDVNDNVGQVLTSSLEALKHYQEADRERGFSAKVRLLEKAIAIDPEFSMAYRALGKAYLGHYETAKGQDYLQRAFGFRDRLPLRERCKIEASYYEQSSKTVGLAVEAWNKLLEVYPDDLEGTTGLANTYLNGGEVDRAMAAVLDRATRAKIEEPWGKDVLVMSYLDKGWIRKAEEFARFWAASADRAPSLSTAAKASPLFYLSWALSNAGKFDAAIQEADKMLGLVPKSYLAVAAKGLAYHLKGDFPRAESEYLKLETYESSKVRADGVVKLGQLYLMQGKYAQAAGKYGEAALLAEKDGDSEFNGVGHHYLGYIHFRQGNYPEALDDLRNAGRLLAASDCVPNRLLWGTLASMGAIYLAMNQRQELQEVADALKGRVQETAAVFPNLNMYATFAQALLDLADKNDAKAIGGLEEFRRLRTYPCISQLCDDLLASTFFRTGDLDKAQAAYESVILLSNDRILLADVYPRCFYMLGKIAEQKGEQAKAREYCRKFLTLWKDADPGQPEVNDAKARLADASR